MEAHDLLAGLGVLLGLVGILLVFLPGLIIEVAAVAIWASVESTAVAWIVLGLTVALAVLATVLKFAFPHRKLREAGISARLILLALVAAVIGLFVIPGMGAPIAFVLTIYTFERARRGRSEAWPATKTAVGAVLASVGIELAGGFLILAVFVGGAFLT